jgi:hypothetical protein
MAARIQSAQFSHTQRIDSTLAVGSLLDRKIVDHHQLAVSAAMYIQFNARHPHLQGNGKGWKSIFGRNTPRATMRKNRCHQNSFPSIC